MLTQPEAAKKIKSELKAAFPKIKFSVTSSKGSSSYLHINYEDGLEYSNQIKKDVEKIAYANCSGWNLLINHNMSAGIKAEIESMISAYYKEPYNERNDSHRSLKMKIFNQEAMANLPVKKEPVAEVKEVINITEGLTGVVEKPADNDETTPVYCIECCEGYGNKPYAQGGAVDIENAIYFDSVESMQNAINLHRQGMRDFGGYDKHFVIVTMPTSGTSHKFRIDVSKKEEVYVKQELLDCFIGNKKFLESIKGSKMESPEHKQELSDYKWKIEKAVEWVNSKPEIKPEPIIDDVISAVDNKPNDNQPIYKIVWADGVSGEPYSRGGSVDDFGNGSLVFKDIESLERAINYHCQHQSKSEDSEHYLNVTLPNGELYDFRIYTKRGDVINLKKEIMRNLITVNCYLSSKNINPEEAKKTGETIRMILDWMKPKPIHPEYQALTSEQLINYLSHYEAWLKGLMASGKLSIIQSFESWYESVKDGTIELMS